LQTRFGTTFADGFDRGFGKQMGVDTVSRTGHQPCHRFQTVGFEGFGAGAQSDSGRNASGLAEGRAQFTQLGNLAAEGFFIRIDGDIALTRVFSG